MLLLSCTMYMCEVYGPLRCNRLKGINLLNNTQQPINPRFFTNLNLMPMFTFVYFTIPSIYTISHALHINRSAAIPKSQKNIIAPKKSQKNIIAPISYRTLLRWNSTFYNYSRERVEWPLILGHRIIFWFIFMGFLYICFSI